MHGSSVFIVIWQQSANPSHWINFVLVGLRLNNDISNRPGDHVQPDYLRPPREVCEAHFHQSYKLCVIGAIPSQTYSNVWIDSSKIGEFSVSHRFLMALLQSHNVYKLGEDELPGPPVVALMHYFWADFEESRYLGHKLGAQMLTVVKLWARNN